MPTHRRNTLLSIVLVLAVLAWGGFPVAAAASAPRAPRWDTGCSENWPTRVKVDASTDEEAYYNQFSPVCASADGSTLAIFNRSNVVWYFLDPLEGDMYLLGGGKRARSFSNTVVAGGLARYEYVAPTEVVQLPADTSLLKWHIDRALTAAWLAQDIYLNSIVKYGKAATKKALTNGTKARTAVYDCTMAFWTATRNGKDISSDTGYQQILDTLPIAAETGACAKSWKAALAKSGAKKFPSLTEGVIRAGESASAVTRVRSVWGWVVKFCAAIPRCGA